MTTFAFLATLVLAAYWTLIERRPVAELWTLFFVILIAFMVDIANSAITLSSSIKRHLEGETKKPPRS